MGHKNGGQSWLTVVFASVFWKKRGRGLSHSRQAMPNRLQQLFPATEAPGNYGLVVEHYPLVNIQKTMENHHL